MKIDRVRELRIFVNVIFIHVKRLDSKEQKITFKLNNYSFYKLTIYSLYNW